MNAFSPPPRLLMGPGPSNVSPEVLAAQARPTIGHLDPSFVGLMDRIKDQLRLAFRTDNRVTFPLSAPASLAMEMALVTLLEPGDTAIIAQNGVFGGRMAEIARRAGAEVRLVSVEWGKPVDPEAVRASILEAPQAKLLAFVHAETSTGVRSDAASLCALAREAGLLSVVDTVTGLGGIPVSVDEWQADAVYAGTQKCLSAPPGLAPITFSDRAVSAVKARKTPIQSWFLDLGLMLGYWEGRVPDPITTPRRSMRFTACTKAFPACWAKAWRLPGRVTAPPMTGWSNGYKGWASPSSSTRSTDCRS